MDLLADMSDDDAPGGARADEEFLFGAAFLDEPEPRAQSLTLVNRIINITDMN